MGVYLAKEASHYMIPIAVENIALVAGPLFIILVKQLWSVQKKMGRHGELE